MHPNDLELDALRGGGSSADAAHVATCAECRTRLAALRVLAATLAAPVERVAVAVPAAQDAWLVAAAHDRGAKIRNDRRRRAAFIAVPAFAAAALVTLLLVTRHAAPVAREDVNHDGRVDILDAFAVQRAVDTKTARPDWDFNHDGVVDRADVRRLADLAVSVKGAAQ